MKGRTAPILLATATALVAACGDVVLDSSGTIKSLPDPDNRPPSSTPVQPASFCPVARPEPGALCDHTGSTCEYGSSADLLCNAMFQCVGDARIKRTWLLRRSGDCRSDACPIDDVSHLQGQPCRVSIGAAIDGGEIDGGEIDSGQIDGGQIDSGQIDGGSSSDYDELLCNVNDGVCACTTGRDEAHAHERRWECVRPLAECPQRRPLVGERCDGKGQIWCDYGYCASKRGVIMECIDDFQWSMAEGVACD